MSAALLARLQQDVVKAMRDHDDVARDALRMVVAAVKSRQIDLDRPLSDEEALALVKSAVKSRADAAQQFEQAGRNELAAKERREIEVLSDYLPRQLSEGETRALLARLVAETGAVSKQDLGKVMKALMSAHKDEVDGKLAQRVLGELLP